MSTKKTVMKLNTGFIAIEISYMMALSALLGFSIVYLRYLDFTNTQISIILSLKMIASIFSQMMVGNFLENNKNISIRKAILVIVILACIINLFLIILPKTFIIVAIIFILFGITEYSGVAFVNSLAINYTNKGIEINFGLARGLGSLAYAVGSKILGEVSAGFGESYIPFVHMVYLLICVVSVVLFKKPKIRKSNKNNIEKIGTNKKIAKNMDNETSFEMLKNNKVFLYFLIFSSLVLMGHTLISNSLPLNISNRGGDENAFGTALAIAALSEVPIMCLFSKITKKFPVNKILVFSTFFFFMKSLCLLLTVSLSSVYALQATQMFGYGLFLPSTIYFVNEIVKQTQKIRGQAILNAVTTGVASTIATLLCGVLLDKFGVGMVLINSTIFTFAGFVLSIYVCFILYNKRTIKIIK